MFRLQVKEGSWSDQVPPRRVSYVLQESLKEKPDRLYKQQIIVPSVWMKHQSGATVWS